MIPAERHGDGELVSTRVDYDNETVLAVDLGPVPDDRVSIDVVDDTAVIVVETDVGSEQREFELPAGDAQAFIRNGVVTIEVKR